MKQKSSEIEGIYITKINDIKWKAKIDREDFEIEFPDNYPYSPPNFTLKKKDYVKEEKIKSIVKKEWSSKILINDILGYIYNFLRLLDLKKSVKKINENEYLNIKEKTDDLKVINLINLLLKEKCKNNALQDKNLEIEKNLEEISLDKGQIIREKKNLNKKSFT